MRSRCLSVRASNSASTVGVVQRGLQRHGAGLGGGGSVSRSSTRPLAMARRPSTSIQLPSRSITCAASTYLRPGLQRIALQHRARTVGTHRRAAPRVRPAPRFSRKLSSSMPVLQVLLVLAQLDLVQRRLRDVDVAALHQLRHLPVEEGQQQRADVRAVHVGVGHDDDAVVAQLVDVEVFAADAGAQRGDQRDDGCRWTAASRSAPSRRSGSCRAAAGSPGTCGRAPAWPSRRRSRPPRCRSRTAPGPSPGSRPACRAGPCRRARPCGASSRGPCGRPRGHAPRRRSCRR
jgi:hypothetical protein